MARPCSASRGAEALICLRCSSVRGTTSAGMTLCSKYKKEFSGNRRGNVNNPSLNLCGHDALVFEGWARMLEGRKSFLEGAVLLARSACPYVLLYKSRSRYQRTKRARTKEARNETNVTEHPGSNDIGRACVLNIAKTLSQNVKAK